MRHKIPTCLLLFLIQVFIFTSCSPNPEQTKESYYNKALEYIENDDNASAIIELRNAIQEDAKYADARYQLGLIYLEQGDPAAAFGQLQRAANLNHQNVDANLKVAEFYMLSKKNEETRKHLTRVLDKEPQNIDGLALLANIEIVEGNFGEAESALDKVTGEDAETARFYSIRGRLLSAQEKYTASEAAFQKAIELEPDKLSHYQILLILYQQQNEEEKSEKLINQIAASFPESIPALILQARYHSSRNDLEKTGTVIKKIIDLEPDKEEHRLFYANFLKNQKKFKEAEDVLKAGLETAPDSADLQGSLADLYFSTRRLEESRELMDNVFTTTPEHQLTTLVKAKFLLAENKYNEATEILNVLTADYPKWAEPYYYLALTHLRLGETDLAQRHIKSALQLAPAKSEYHSVQSQLYLMQGDAQSAGKEATIALKLDKQNYEAAKQLTRALLQNKRFEEAVTLITDIRKQVPYDPELILSLGYAYLGQKDIENALNAFTTLLNKYPDNSKALAMVASLSSKGDIDKGIEIITEQIELTPEAPGHYMLLGDLYIRKKDAQKALEQYAKAQELTPENPRPYIMRAQVMGALGETDKAVEEFRQLLDTNPESIPANLGLAALLESQKKFAEAKLRYEKVLEAQPDQAVAANNLAYIIASEPDSDLGEALRLAMIAKQAKPQDPRIADTLGYVHLKRGSFGIAIPQFEQALEQRTDDPVIAYHLASAYYGNGEEEKALELLEKALQTASFPERQGAENLLKEIQQKQ